MYHQKAKGKKTLNIFFSVGMLMVTNGKSRSQIRIRFRIVSQWYGSTTLVAGGCLSTKVRIKIQRDREPGFLLILLLSMAEVG
jgi:hypothetical protein